MSEAIPALIQAGGFGTRIRSKFPDIPKPLVPIAGRSVLFRQIDWLRENGVFEIFILAGYKADLIERAIKFEYNDPRISVLVEGTPLGSGGCLSLAKPFVSSTSLVVSADVIFEFPLTDLIRRHRESKAEITLTLYATRSPFEGDLVKITSEGDVECLLMRPHNPETIFENRVNAAASVVEPAIIQGLPDRTPLNFEADIVQTSLRLGKRVTTFTPKGYIKDIGTPGRWDEATHDFSQGSRPSERVYVLDMKSALQKPMYQARDADWESWCNLNENLIHELKCRTEDGHIIVGLLPHTTELSHSFRIPELDTLLAKRGLKIDYFMEDS